MSANGRNFGSENSDWDNLQVKGEHLYWNGKKLRTEGLSVTEKLGIAAILVSVLFGVANLVGRDTIGHWICKIHSFSTCANLSAQGSSVVTYSASNMS